MFLHIHLHWEPQPILPPLGVSCQLGNDRALCALWCSSEQQSALDLRVPEDYCDKNSFLPTDKYHEGISLTAEGSHKVSKSGVKSDPPPPADMKLTHPARLIWFGISSSASEFRADYSTPPPARTYSCYPRKDPEKIGIP